MGVFPRARPFHRCGRGPGAANEMPANASGYRGIHRPIRADHHGDHHAVGRIYQFRGDRHVLGNLRPTCPSRSVRGTAYPYHPPVPKGTLSRDHHSVFGECEHGRKEDLASVGQFPLYGRSGTHSWTRSQEKNWTQRASGRERTVRHRVNSQSQFFLPTVGKEGGGLAEGVGGIDSKSGSGRGISSQKEQRFRTGKSGSGQEA